MTKTTEHITVNNQDAGTVQRMGTATSGFYRAVSIDGYVADYATREEAVAAVVERHA